MATCINDVVLNRRVAAHEFPVVSREETKEVLEELAELLEETKGHIGAANTFPMWMQSLVGVMHITAYGDTISYQFLPERKIHLCTKCVSFIWQKIALFKEKYPELFIPTIKEPEFD